MIGTEKVLMLVSAIFSSAFAQDNNVCPTFDDYYTMRNNSKCWYDLTAEFTAPEIIQRMGYPVLEYKVKTEDGYILTTYRIPNLHTKNSHTQYHPVFLQHGLVSTCANFLARGKDSLAFVLADQGYDVWLGNYRGTFYSEEHVNLTVYDEEFWDHGLDEVALFDIRANFHTILEHSDPGSKIIFIAHSLGSSVALMYCSEYPAECEQIMKLMVFMSPAYTLTNMISPFKMTVPMGDTFIDMARRLKLFRIYSQASELRRMVVPTCMENPEIMRYCMQIYNIFYGSESDLGPETIPVYFNQLPGGTSIRILNHAGDLVKGNFRKYNFKKSLNLKRYGRSTPPEYDIKKVQVPIYLIVSAQDWTTSEADARILWRKLPEKAKYGFKRIDAKFNHIDFIFGRHARVLAYDHIAEVLNNATRS